MDTEQNPSARQTATEASVVKPKRRWLRVLLTGITLLVIGILIGRQMTKERWHTLYSHPQPGNKLMLVAECPQGWEEDSDPILRAQTDNTLWIHPKPAIGLLKWWQEHILHQRFRDHTIMLEIIEKDRPASKAENELMTSTEKKVDPAPTTTLTRHRLGPEIDRRIDMAPMRGFPADTSPSTITTMISMDETPTKNGATIVIMSNEVGRRDRDAYRIRKEIIRRIRVVKR